MPAMLASLVAKEIVSALQWLGAARTRAEKLVGLIHSDRRDVTDVRVGMRSNVVGDGRNV